MTHGPRTLSAVCIAVTALAAGCAGVKRPEAPTPAPSEAEGAAAPGAAGPVRGKLPPIPERDGPLQLDVVYPQEGSVVAVRDSTFIFGSTGTGAATLTINGAPVEVRPNGSFLAYLPVPIDGVYRLGASVAGLSRELQVHVTVPPPVIPPPSDSAAIVAGSVGPSGAWAAVPGERIVVSFRGTPGGLATLVLPDGQRIAMSEVGLVRVEQAAQRNFGDVQGVKNTPVQPWSSYRGYFIARRLATADTTVPWPSLATTPRPAAAPATASLAGRAARPGRPAKVTRARVRVAADTAHVLLGSELGEAVAYVELVAHGDTVREPLRMNLVVLPEGRLRVGEAVLSGPRPQSPGHVRGNVVENGTWVYFWPAGTRFNINGQRGSEYRLELAPGHTAWVDTADVRLLPAALPPVRGHVGTVRLKPYEDAVDVRVQLGERLPFRLQPGDHTFSITIYGGEGDTDYLRYGGVDPFVRQGHWEQIDDGVYRLTLELSDWPWGYRKSWDANGDLVIRLRKPPRIDPAAPLRGLTIAIDAGHPPGGAISPLRMTEAQANFAIAQHLQALLQQAGARVVMTRPDTMPLGLYERPERAESEDADLFISIHNNAFPDGVNPWVNSGTSDYYFHLQSALLAEDIQKQLVSELGLRDLGSSHGSYAVIRNTTWMPAVLTETMFMMVPVQGAALADPSVQQRIAEAHLRGIEAFVRERARTR